MIYNDCRLYGIHSKKNLWLLLHIRDSKFAKQSSIAAMITPYIDRTGKPRLIEPPQRDLKEVQKQIKKLLGQIKVPDNVFSGVKGKSYADNARMHVGDRKRNLFKIDLTAFFPSIRRERVYKFFREDLRCAPDVAEILTNLTTVDLEKSQAQHPEEIYAFLESKGVMCRNHLISGAPTSQILSYLVNHEMFDEMQAVADKNNALMTIYVDDVTFSSENRLSGEFRNRIFDIIHKYDYKISAKKVKNYTKQYPKLVTGVVIDANGKPTVKNSIRLKIIMEYEYLRHNPDDNEARQRLKGLLSAARQVEPYIYPNIYKFAYEE